MSVKWILPPEEKRVLLSKEERIERLKDMIIGLTKLVDEELSETLI